MCVARRDRCRMEALPIVDSARVLRKPFSEEQLFGAIASAIRGSVYDAS